MKKLVFIFLFILSSLCSIAQMDTYHAVSLRFGTWNPVTEDYIWKPRLDVNIPVTVQDNVINIYSQVHQRFIITSDAKDLDENTIEFSAIDQDGDRCILRFSNISGSFFFTISYSNICYYYKLEEY